MAYVNLWELITIVANKKHDLPGQEKCESLQTLCGRVGGFGTELAMEVDEIGNWTVSIFSHENGGGEIKLIVSKRGDITVSRMRPLDDMVDRRSIAF